MSTNDPKKSIRRKTVHVESTGQISLLAGPKQAKAKLKPSPVVPKLKFNDPDPESLAFGDTSLRFYLIKAGLGFAIHTRNLFDELDLTEFEAKYCPGGRPPYSPRRMISLIIYAITQGADSLRAIEDLARRDLVALWLTGGFGPDHSTIGRFIQLHHLELQESFFEEMTSKLLGKLPEVSKELSGDGTVIEAASSRFSQIKKEAAEKQLKAAEKKAQKDPKNSEYKEELEKSKAAVDAIKKRQEARKGARKSDPDKVTVNPHEPEAVIHKQKNGLFRFSFFAAILANRQRIIVGQSIHPTNECAVVQAQLEQATRILASPPERVCLDSGYFISSILRMACDTGLDLLCVPPEKSRSHKRRRKKQKVEKVYSKQKFLYNPDDDTYTCPAGETLSPATPASERDPSKAAYYGTPKCENCPLRDQCTKSDRGRRIRREKDDECFEMMREVMSQPQAQKTYQQRQGTVEPVFGELRHIQGLQRFKRKGLQGVGVEFSLHAMAHNLRRMWVLLGMLGGINSLFGATLGLFRAPISSQSYFCSRHGHYFNSCHRTFYSLRSFPKYRQLA